MNNSRTSQLLLGENEKKVLSIDSETNSGTLEYPTALEPFRRSRKNRRIYPLSLMLSSKRKVGPVGVIGLELKKMNDLNFCSDKDERIFLKKSLIRMGYSVQFTKRS